MIPRNVNRVTSRKNRWLLAGAIALFVSLPFPLFAQDPLIAAVETVEPPLLVPADPGSSPETEAPLPGPLVETGNASVDSGIPRRFHYTFRLTLRGVYDDNVNLNRDNRISDFYTTFEPSVSLGFGDIVGRQENYIRIDYLASAFFFADHSENNALQHVFRLEGQYRVSRLTLTLSQIVQIMDGTDVQAFNNTGGFDQQVNLDVAGRTRFNVYTTHLNAAYYLTGKTFLSAGADYTRSDYSTLISSEVVSGNLFLNYNYSPKLVLGAGGTVGYNQVDDPNPDQSFVQANARISYQITGKLDALASGGVEFRDFKGGGQDQYVSPVFEGALNYAPFDGTKLSLSANHRILNSAVLTGENYAVTNITVAVQQRFLQRFYLGLNAGYENANYFSTVAGLNSTRDDDYYFVEPSIAVRVTRFWTVGAYYLHRENTSSFDAFSFHDNQVGLRTSLTF
jgi:hypothetical protein